MAIQSQASSTQGKCRFCGQNGQGIAFSDWVKDSFTDWDKLQPGVIVCNSCLFWFDEQSAELAQRVGKDKPQKMRNYSHFMVSGQWEPVSKGNKARMRELLLSHPFPEMAVIADSGQKHLVFRAVRNPQGSNAGWVQFEEQRVWVVPANLGALLEVVERLYATFSKGEIESGQYSGSRALKFGLDAWQVLEQQLKRERGKPLFALAIFLAQRKEGEDGRDTSEDGGAIGADLEGDACGLQEPVPENDLAAVRGSGQIGGVYQQPGKDAQLTLFEVGG